MKTKQWPNYIVKAWQYWIWLIIGFFLTCFFMVKMLGGANEAIIGVIGFALMNARLIVLRSRWKKQNKENLIRRLDFRLKMSDLQSGCYNYSSHYYNYYYLKENEKR